MPTLAIGVATPSVSSFWTSNSPFLIPPKTWIVCCTSKSFVKTSFRASSYMTVPSKLLIRLRRLTRLKSTHFLRAPNLRATWIIRRLKIPVFTVALMSLSWITESDHFFISSNSDTMRSALTAPIVWMKMRYGSCRTATVYPVCSDKTWPTNWAKARFVRDPKLACIMTKSSQFSTTIRLSVGTRWSFLTCSTVSSIARRIVSLSAGYFLANRVAVSSGVTLFLICSSIKPLIHPTSWATSKGTGISSPTQLGMAPVGSSTDFT